MNDKYLQQLLAKQQYVFENEFAQKVVNAVLENTTPAAVRNIFWYVSGVAASLLLCSTVVYLQDGYLSFDTFLGIDSLNNDTLNELSFYL